MNTGGANEDEKLMQAHNSSLTCRQNNASNQNYINSNAIVGGNVTVPNRLAHMHSQATNRNGSASLGGVGGHGSQPVVVISDSMANGPSYGGSGGQGRIYPSSLSVANPSPSNQVLDQSYSGGMRQKLKPHLLNK